LSSVILKCTSCKAYTMQEKCDCGGKAVTPHPPRFSPEDRYGKYRRKLQDMAEGE